MSLRLCPEHQIEWKTIPAGVSKKTGNPYASFKVCPVKDCMLKPPKEDQDESTAWLDDDKPNVSVAEKPDWDAKDRRIVRQNVLRHATEIVTSDLGNQNDNQEDKFKQVIKLAEQFEEWVYRE